MSDMYLVLRRRLNAVATEWYEIPSDVLLQAQKQRGLSYESAARQVPVSAKTWERWVKRGRVPIWHLEKVADILGLEIEQPAMEPLRVAAPIATLEGVALVLAAIEEQREELRQLLLELLERLPPAKPEPRQKP